MTRGSVARKTCYLHQCRDYVITAGLRAVWGEKRRLSARPALHLCRRWSAMPRGMTSTIEYTERSISPEMLDVVRPVLSSAVSKLR